MKHYRVTGMSCAACSSRVEKAVSKVQGVTSCSVSLLTNTMGVEGTASADDVISAVEKAGYKAELKGEYSSEKNEKNSKGDKAEDKEIWLLKCRLIASGIFLIILMYFSMGHMMWGFPVPQILADNHIAMGLLQLLLTAVIMVINQRFFISGFKSLLHGSPNMDTLVALGAGAAFVYSTY
ncbi:MAG: cation transporter, partial [Oscillospiraceae bacterium]|nr:cation transporter [Oscillospiraceae bacterium]